MRFVSPVRRLSVAIIFLSFSAYLCASDWVVVDPKSRIADVIFDDSVAGWVIQGQIDLDMDGDLDLLVGHEHKYSEFLGGEYVGAEAYLKEGDKFLHSKTQSGFPLPVIGAEFRTVKGADGRVIVSYLSLEDGRDVVSTAWYSRTPKDEIKKNMHYLHQSMLLDATPGDVVQESYGPVWSERGVHISNILQNYRKISLEDARKEFAEFRTQQESFEEWIARGVGSQGNREASDGGGGPEAQGAKEDALTERDNVSVVDKEDKAGVSKRAEKGDADQEMAGENKIELAWAAFVVLGVFGLAVVSILYRRRKD